MPPFYAARPFGDELQVERFRAQGLKKVKRENAQGRLNLEMANVRSQPRKLHAVFPSHARATVVGGLALFALQGKYL